jgi:NADH-quinone oxidoreductase subunit E
MSSSQNRLMDLSNTPTRNPVSGSSGEPPAETGPLVDFDRLGGIIREFEGQQGAIIPILQRTQDVCGYLPREALAYISKKTLIPLNQLYGVATFYTQFHLARRGKHLIRICDGTACHVRGAAKNIAAVEKAIGVAPGETSPDYKFTIEIVYCLGSCGISPVALVDDMACGRLSADELVNRVRTLE